MIPEVVLGEDAYERLAAHVRGAALVVMDANTEAAAGRDVVRALPGADELVFAERSGLIAGEDEVDRVRRRIGDRTPVAVGSGVITDIVRYAAHLNNRDFVSVPTAASMDGYASGHAALQRHGVKVTLSARPPQAIFADPRIAARAPRELTRAGIGDLLAKASARTDWLAAHLLYGERFDPRVDAAVREPLEFATHRASQILDGDVAGLLQGLIQSGIAMAIVGSSRPASGCEHHASHFWDLLAAHGRRSHHPHGLQVGYATRFALRLQTTAFGPHSPPPHPPVPPADPLGPEARGWLGEPTPEIIEAVAEKQRLRPPGDWAERWASIKDRLAPALGLAPAVGRALTEIGIPATPGYLEIDEPTLRATFPHATRLRARYTTVDFLEGQGRLEAAIEALPRMAP